MWLEILVAYLATNFQDLVAKVKNLVALAPVLGAILRPAIYDQNGWKAYPLGLYMPICSRPEYLSLLLVVPVAEIKVSHNSNHWTLALSVISTEMLNVMSKLLFCASSQTWLYLLKLINNSSSLNKRDLDCDSVLITDLNPLTPSQSFLPKTHFRAFWGFSG